MTRNIVPMLCWGFGTAHCATWLTLGHCGPLLAMLGLCWSHPGLLWGATVSIPDVEEEGFPLARAIGFGCFSGQSERR